MKKRTYRSKEIKKINWHELKENLSGEKIAVAIDVAAKVLNRCHRKRTV